MRHETLLISIRRLRMIEVDGLGAFAQIELGIARTPESAKSKKPHMDIASFTLFAPAQKRGQTSFLKKNGSDPFFDKKRWEAS